MEKRKCLAFLFCLILCYSLFQHTARAQSSSQASIFSQGSITYSPSNVNLAVIPDDWEPYDGVTVSYGTGPQIIFVDFSVVRTAGKPSIRSEAHTSADMNTYRECDGTWYSVKPGNHIVASCWIYVGDSGLGNNGADYLGGRLGFDCYAHTSIGYQIVDTYPHDGAEHLASVVHWGTKTWIQKTWDIIVPSTFYTKIFNPWPTGTPCDPVQIDSFVLWLDVRPVGDTGKAWFADAELYINPT